MNNKNILYMILAIFILVFSVNNVFAVPVGPSAVTGTITYANGTNVTGATVDVTCEHLGVNTTLSTTSLSDGSYYVEYNQSQCGFNDWVWVTATKDSESGHSTGQTCNVDHCFIPIALVDVQIPEFGLLGAMFIVLAGVGIVAYKRKD